MFQHFWFCIASQTSALWAAAVVPVWPHVLDLWCAGLVTIAAEHTALVFLRRFCDALHAYWLSSGVWVHVSLKSRPCCSRQPPRRIGVGHVSRWWYALISLLLLHCGEATNPGPVAWSQKKPDKARSWSMGTFNPSGLGGKHHVVSSYLRNCNLWAVTETHLTSQGMRSFRQGLKWSGYVWFSIRFLHWGSAGAPSFPFVCNWPVEWSRHSFQVTYTRAVPVAWGENVFETSRVQLAATLCEDMWFTGGVLYGEPPGISHPNARENTDTMALEIVSHLCQQSGLRYFAGDLNFEAGGLEVFKVLSDAGFRDIQDIALERWGQQVQMTCKHKTRKDFFFISRELAPFLTGVTVDHTVWSDHAVLQGFFCCGPSHITRHLWRQPRPVEWPLI